MTHDRTEKKTPKKFHPLIHFHEKKTKKNGEEVYKN